MRIATWNINGIKARFDSLSHWLREASPDVVCLQEVKSQEESFPRAPIEALGYNLEVVGQKGFNGVAILSKHRLEDARRGLPGDDGDVQARFLEAVVSAPAGIVRIACAYMPNGNPIGTEKFAYKLAWHERLEHWARDRLSLEEPLVLAGDFNVIPTPLDAKRPQAWANDALYQPEARQAFRRLAALGMTDAIRAVDDGPGRYTFWDYQAGCWQKDDGIRIDHLMLSPEAADRLRSAGIDRHTRAWEKPSDHVPVWIELAD
ncbi:exodeoxyribonuclease III [Faunimonas sp. B44]|uniref:exodeoxyribonuclease III n=1 Tax=Faunimonas sp. B44 TaxID=3461493 RepID=UPI00404459B5